MRFTRVLLFVPFVTACAAGATDDAEPTDAGGRTDAAPSDAGLRDARSPGDASDVDAQEDEASVPDADAPDTAPPLDGALLDAAIADAAPLDSGVADAGHDAGPLDAGGTDAGCPVALRVNEVRMESAGKPFDQFVELYNAGGCPVALSGLRLAMRAAHATVETTLWIGSGTKTIAPGGYFLLAGNDFTGTTRDASLAATLIDRAGGGIGLYAGSTLVDSLGWGSADNAFVETDAAASPSLGQSLARSPNGYDSGNNWDDFVATSQQTPRAAN